MDTVKAVTELDDGYILKPVERERLIQDLLSLGLIPSGEGRNTPARSLAPYATCCIRFLFDPLDSKVE
jgi:hypothetical protein